LILEVIRPTIARNMTRASRTSWQSLPPPQQHEALGFAATFNDAETELLVLGLVPPDAPFVPAQSRAK
jgi:hypothetical protein